MKYHIKNKNSKKNIRKERMKPLPISLMLRRLEDDKTERIGTKQRKGRGNKGGLSDFGSTKGLGD